MAIEWGPLRTHVKPDYDPQLDTKNHSAFALKPTYLRRETH